MNNALSAHTQSIAELGRRGNEGNQTPSRTHLRGFSRREALQWQPRSVLTGLLQLVLSDTADCVDSGELIRG